MFWPKQNCTYMYISICKCTPVYNITNRQYDTGEITLTIGYGQRNLCLNFLFGWLPIEMSEVSSITLSPIENCLSIRLLLAKWDWSFLDILNCSVIKEWIP